MVLIALLLVVLLALAGIVIDLGALFQERRELRNAADAAVLAIAEDCGTGAQPCDTDTAFGTAGFYANANVEDGAAGITSLDLDLDAQSVRVVTHAVDPESGQQGVEVSFMKILGFDRMTVNAPAAAIWGHPRSGGGIPITYELCEFEKTGLDNTVILSFHDPQDRDVEEDPDCAAGPAGSDAPGAFGWLEPIEKKTCWVELSIDSWDNGPTVGVGVGGPTFCTAQEIYDAIYRKIVMVPLYSDVRGEGSNTEYYVVGFGGFFVEMYRLGNSGDPQGPLYRMPEDFVCPDGPSEACLVGHFTEFTTNTGDTGGPDFGVTIVKLIE